MLNYATKENMQESFFMVINTESKTRDQQFADEILNEAFYGNQLDLAEILFLLCSVDRTEQDNQRIIDSLTPTQIDQIINFLEAALRTRKLMLEDTKICSVQSILNMIIFLAENHHILAEG
jgi:hypothetical protein